MSDIFADNMPHLNTVMKTQAATLLTYRRGGATVEIAMTLGSKANPLYSVLGSTPGGLDMLLENAKNAVRSFVFDALDLDFGSGPVLPENSGDQILETINGVVCVFDVMPPMQGILAWAWATELRGPGARIIVHTQLTGTE